MCERRLGLAGRVVGVGLLQGKERGSGGVGTLLAR